MKFSEFSVIPAEMQSYFVPTALSAFLIASNSRGAASGYCLRMTYPSRDSSSSCNLAELPVPSSNKSLAVTLLSESGFRSEDKQANWSCLVHRLLETTICYIEAPSAQYRTKCIATRNLHLCNAMSSTPIANWDLFYKILSGDIGYFTSLRDAGKLSEEVYTSVVSVIKSLSASDNVDKNVLLWLAETFNADKNLLKAYINAHRMLQRDWQTECDEHKCGYIKLKATPDGHLEMPQRVLGTAYVLPKSAILVPLAFMRQQAQIIMSLMKDHIVIARFQRDNEVVRDMVTTSHPAVLERVFGKSLSDMPTVFHEDRGYIQVIDICSSLVGNDMLRAISLARLEALWVLQPELDNLGQQLAQWDFDPSYAHTDFNAVLPRFQKSLAALRGNMALLTMLYQQLTGITQTANLTSPYQLETLITGFIDKQMTLTSSYIRKLHLFMLNNPLIFQGYTGLPEKIGDVEVRTSPVVAMGIAPIGGQ